MQTSTPEQIRATVRELPTAIAGDSAAYTGCIARAASVAELERSIAGAGFADVRVAVQAQSGPSSRSGVRAPSSSWPRH